VLVDPSPKFHPQELGLPEVVSENWTVWPGAGVAGLKTNVAGEGAGTTAKVFMAFLEFVPLAAVNVTL
jgi:hypothetical protein